MWDFSEANSPILAMDGDADAFWGECGSTTWGHESRAVLERPIDGIVGLFRCVQTSYTNLNSVARLHGAITL